MTSANISNWKFSLGTDESPQVLTEIEEVTEISGFGQTNDLAEATNFDSPAGTKEFIAGLSEGDEFTVECNYIPAATMQVAARAAVKAGATRLARVRYTGSSPENVFDFSAVCLGYALGPSPTEVNSITFTFKISGDITET